MDSQLISNTGHSFFLTLVLTALLTVSIVKGASYEKLDGTIVDPIVDRSGIAHSHSGPDLEPGADLPSADLSNADLYNADLYNANLSNANLSNADLSNADLSNADLTFAGLIFVNLSNTDVYNADLSYANLSNADLSDADLFFADLSYADLSNADLSNADLIFAVLDYADLYGVSLNGAIDVEISTGSPYYYPNTTLPSGFDPVAQDWRLAPYCDFTPDAVCDLADINQIFEAGNLVTGVATSGSTDRLDLVDNNTLDVSDVTEWLAQAATANGHGSPYLRGDATLDRDVDITDFNSLATNFDPTGDGDPQNGPWWNEGNFDGDDDTDITDFNGLASNFTPGGYGASAIPEPTALVLVVAGFLMLVLTRQPI